MGELTPAERKHRLEAAKQGLADADSTLGRAAWQWGTLLKEVRDEELWREDDATSLSGWCEDVLAISRRTANRAIALSEHFTQEMAGRFGSRKLAAAIDYIELTGKLEKPGDILALEIRFRGDAGKFTTVKFPKATVKQIEGACTALRESARARAEKEAQAQLETEVRAQIEAIEKDLPAAPPGTVRGDRVVAKKASDGTVALAIQGIPLVVWQEFMAYQRSKVPVLA